MKIEKVRRAGGKRLCIIYVKINLISSVTCMGISTHVDNNQVLYSPLSLPPSIPQ